MKVTTTSVLAYKTETVDLAEATQLQSNYKDDTNHNVNFPGDATYSEYYAGTITPKAYMVSYGRRATLVIECNVSVFTGGTGEIKTTVGVDVKETIGIAGTGVIRHVHTDITDFSAGIAVKLESRHLTSNGHTLDYMYAYLQLGTKSLSSVEIIRRIDYKSIAVEIGYINALVWTGAVDVSQLEVRKDGTYGNMVVEAATETSKHKYAGLAEFMIGPIDTYLSIYMFTDNADNPAILRRLTYNRGYFE